jgi:hypothetical protein
MMLSSTTVKIKLRIASLMQLSMSMVWNAGLCSEQRAGDLCVPLKLDLIGLITFVWASVRKIRLHW